MNKYEMQEFNVWINDTQLRCLAHANNLLILQFKRPGTILYSETVTMLNDNPDSLGTIHFSGDGGEASYDGLIVNDRRDDLSDYDFAFMIYDDYVE